MDHIANAILCSRLMKIEFFVDNMSNDDENLVLDIDICLEVNN